MQDRGRRFSSTSWHALPPGSLTTRADGDRRAGRDAAAGGRPRTSGVGCRTVARALQRAGIGGRGHRRADVSRATSPPRWSSPRTVRAIQAEQRRPVLAVLNKADLPGFGRRWADGGGAGPRCARFLRAASGCPWSRWSACSPSPRSTIWTKSSGRAAHVGRRPGLGLTFPGSGSVRLLDALDLFGIALAVAAVRQGKTSAQVRALLWRISGVDAVLAKSPPSVPRRATGGCWTLSRNWRPWPFPAVSELSPAARSPGSSRSTTRSSPGWPPRLTWPNVLDCKSSRAAMRPGTCRGRCAGGAIAVNRPAPCTVHAARISSGGRYGSGRRPAGRPGDSGVTDGAHDDPVAGVDALVATVGPRLDPPPINRGTWCW